MQSGPPRNKLVRAEAQPLLLTSIPGAARWPPPPSHGSIAAGAKACYPCCPPNPALALVGCRRPKGPRCVSNSEAQNGVLSPTNATGSSEPSRAETGCKGFCSSGGGGPVTLKLPRVGDRAWELVASDWTTYQAYMSVQVTSWDLASPPAN